MEFISFEDYCIDVEGVVYYVHLTEEERDMLYERYVDYCEVNNYEFE